MKKMIFTILSLSLAFAVGASAQDVLQGRLVTRSDVIESQTQHSLQIQTRLDQAYVELLQQMDGTGRKKLTTAQKAWKGYIKAECDFRATASAVEPLHPMGHEECIMVMNSERAADLKYQLYWYQMLDPSISQQEG